MLAYHRWLAVPLCFQGFEQELEKLPGAYVPPKGGLWLARLTGEAVGLVALRPLKSDPNLGEMKRLWVDPKARGLGLGRRLTQTVMQAAKVAGYRALVLDTMVRMKEAQALYLDLGFQYRAPFDPTSQEADLVYMEKSL